MKTSIWTLLLFTLIHSLAFAAYPEARDEYINDFAQLIDNNVQNDIRKKLYNVEYYSSVEISLVTIDSYGQYETGDQSWEQFSTGLFNRWGVGNKPLNNGVLFIISKNDRKIRIELGAGYPKHYDSIMKSIIDDHVSPALKTGNFTGGITAGIDQIINSTTIRVSFFEWYKWYILAAVCSLISVIVALLIDKKSNPGLFLTLIALAGLLILFILKNLTSGNRSRGFGGGRSGGGGASGSF